MTGLKKKKKKVSAFPGNQSCDQIPFRKISTAFLTILLIYYGVIFMGLLIRKTTTKKDRSIFSI